MPVYGGRHKLRRGSQPIRRLHRYRARVRHRVHWFDLQDRLQEYLGNRVTAEKYLAADALETIIKAWHAYMADIWTPENVAKAANLMPTVEKVAEEDIPDIYGMYERLLGGMDMLEDMSPVQLNLIIGELGPMLVKFATFKFGPAPFLQALNNDLHPYYIHCAQRLNLPEFIAALQHDDLKLLLRNLKHTLIQFRIIPAENPYKPLLLEELLGFSSQLFSNLADVEPLTMLAREVQSIIEFSIFAFSVVKENGEDEPQNQNPETSNNHLALPMRSPGGNSEDDEADSGFDRGAGSSNDIEDPATLPSPIPVINFWEQILADGLKLSWSVRSLRDFFGDRILLFVIRHGISKLEAIPCDKGSQAGEEGSECTSCIGSDLEETCWELINVLSVQCAEIVIPYSAEILNIYWKHPNWLIYRCYILLYPNIQITQDFFNYATDMVGYERALIQSDTFQFLRRVALLDPSKFRIDHIHKIEHFISANTLSSELLRSEALEVLLQVAQKNPELFTENEGSSSSHYYQWVRRGDQDDSEYLWELVNKLLICRAFVSPQESTIVISIMLEAAKRVEDRWIRRDVLESVASVLESQPNASIIHEHQRWIKQQKRDKVNRRTAEEIEQIIFRNQNNSHCLIM